ncbi:E3 ubiquitin-protein ligase BRE1-like 1 [Capsicum annuum]|nr:E3 ubiquitin-protein ligase BRE1-like 1 [Capsicum annuum]
MVISCLPEIPITKETVNHITNFTIFCFFSPMETLLPLDTAVLLHQNQKLSQKLEAQKIEIAVLEDKFTELRDKQKPYDNTVAVIQKSWEELVDKLEVCTMHAKDPLRHGNASNHQSNAEDGSFHACGDSFLSRLLQTGATESSSAVNNQTEYEHKKMDDQKIMNILQNIVSTVDDIWQMKDKLCADLKVLPEDGSCLQNSSSDLHIGVKNLRQTINELHLKHRSLAGALQNHRDTDAKNKAELKCLRGELEKTVAHLDESNRKLAILKAEKDAAKGVLFPVLNLGNKHSANDKARDKQRDMQDMESTLKEYLDQSSFRLLELNRLHEERIDILKQLSNLQNKLKNVKAICSSQPYALVKEQLAKSKEDVSLYQSLYEKLQVEKDNLTWREKEMNLKNDIIDVFRRSSTVADSRIAWLEKEIQKHMQERNMIEAKLEEASREPGRKEIIAEFKKLVSSFPETMGNMQNQLSTYKETASDVHSLRADFQSLSSMLDRKSKELETLSTKSASQVTEMLKLQAMVNDLKESDMQLKLILEMYKRESTFSRDVFEARGSEYRAWACVQSLKTSLDEHNLEVRVKFAIEAEANSQQKLAAAEAEIAELRQKLDASKREQSRLSEVLKSKHEETEAYLSEIETIGQAYDDMQAQNQQLFKQITERDDYNIKLVLEGIRARQQRDCLSWESQITERAVEDANTMVNSYETKAAKIDDQLRGCSDLVQKLAEDRAQNSLALENTQKRLLDVRKSSQQLRETLEELQSKIDKSRVDLAQLQIELEKERFERKRAEEDVEAMRRKILRLRSYIEGSSVIEKLQQKLREYKEILNCRICFDRRKEVVLAKCYHLFCNPCIQKILESRHRKCPVCSASFGANDVKAVYI